MPQRVVVAWAEDRGLWPHERLTAALGQLPDPMVREVLRRRRPQDRQAALLGRLLVRLALATLGVAADFAHWTADRFGRPFLSGCPADVSVSHGDGLVAGAACLGGRVGVDVAVVAPLPLASLEAAFTPGEMADILVAGDQARRALELWTAKEAAIKADGRGLSLDPARIDARDTTIRLDGDVWRVWRCEVRPEGLCAVATDQPACVVDIFEASCADGEPFVCEQTKKRLTWST